MNQERMFGGRRLGERVVLWQGIQVGDVWNQFDGPTSFPGLGRVVNIILSCASLVGLDEQNYACGTKSCKCRVTKDPERQHDACHGHAFLA